MNKFFIITTFIAATSTATAFAASTTQIQPSPMSEKTSTIIQGQTIAHHGRGQSRHYNNRNNNGHYYNDGCYGNNHYNR